MQTYSIALRLRRITYEDAYIAVPVNDAAFKKGEDGKDHFDAVFAEGVRIGEDSRVEWQVEGVDIEVHPIQQAAPEGRKKLDTYFDNPSGKQGS